ncbi:MAG: LUD domain-containing protein [Thaumarchaeota archaeon]|nr:LUD domain-containing protein [Candidatus Calditenuaceae archaeon]MDW8186907.1 LUD domain-containing protein [Nitrososphaerota archaeon]
MDLEKKTSEALRRRDRIERLWSVLEGTKRSRDEGMMRIASSELEAVRLAKQESLHRLDELIDTLKTSVERLGGEFVLARNGEDAKSAIVRVLREHGVSVAIKSKSITSEEIRLNEALRSEGISVVETDLGEWVVQMADERPSHILGPALHMDRKEIAEVLSRSLGTRVGTDLRDISSTARRYLRRIMIDAAAGITGANAIDAETGTIVVVTNEGNELFVVEFPKVVVCLAGVEKLVKGLESAIRVARIQALSAAGRTSSYITLYCPRWYGEKKRFVVVLLDNGRTRARDDPWLWQVNLCIRCGACFNVCNPYKTVSGLVFGGNYSGPIGVALDAVTSGFDVANEYSWLCFGCGLCELECPVGIRIPLLISRVKSFARRDLRLDLLAGGFELYARLGSKFSALFCRAQRSRTFRAALEALAGIDRNAPLPSFRGGTLRKALERVKIGAERDGKRGTVVYFPDTYTSYVDWSVGVETVEVLRSLGYGVVLYEGPGTHMPAIQYGRLGTAMRVAKRISKVLHLYVERGARVVVTEPTAGYCLREVFPAMLGTLESRSIAQSTLNLTELLLADGLLTEFGRSDLAGALAYYHVSCHGLGSGLSHATRSLLEKVGLRVVTRDLGCCGMAGTWGMRSGPVGRGVSSQIGRMVSERIRAERPDFVVTESSVCSLQFKESLNLPVFHTVNVLRRCLARERS